MMPDKPKSKRGGTRPGAGAPLKYGARLTQINVRLDAQTIELLLVLGNGNLTTGIRVAVTRALLMQP